MATADFFPLQVNYEEKMYAAGKFPGGFNKREGRPSTDATLTARLIDRPIRPMFAEGFRNEVQVINTVLSYDENASAPMAAMFGSSLALSISDIPFNGPIAGVQVAYAAEDFIINPSAADKEVSLLDLTVAGTKEAINMVESGAQELSEDIMLQALLKGHEAIQELVDFQNYIVAAVGKEKAEVELLQVDADLKVEIETAYYDQLAKAVQVEEKLAREAATQAVKKKSSLLIKNALQKMKIRKPFCVMWQKSLSRWNMLKYAVSLPRIRFVQMAVVWMKSVLWTQRLTFFLRFMVQVSLHVDKLKPCQF